MSIRQLEQQYLQRMNEGRPVHAWMVAHEGRIRSRAPRTREMWSNRVEHCRRLVNSRRAA